MTKGRDHHADGQKDYSEGKYSEPHSVFKGFVTLNSNRQQEIIDDNSAYRSGQRNAKNQNR